MKQTARIISTYAADVSGVCSALFELGGMTVMHDASGCNSTYNTHDEPRWYDMDSMVYISGLSEMEAIMGDDEKLIEDVCDAALELKPRFIALCGSPIPMIIGTDFSAVASVIEKRTGIPCMGLATNGMHSYISGASMALAATAKRFCSKTASRSKNLSMNLLGCTPLDFSVNGSVESMKQFFKENGFEIKSCFAMGSSLDELSCAGEAQVNLVVSYAGMATAKYIQENFGTPYVAGVPVGKHFSQKIVSLLKEAAASGKSYAACADRAVSETSEVTIIGESIYSGSIASAIESGSGLSTRILCPLETEASLLSPNDKLTPDEDDIMPLIKDTKIVVADPLYLPIIPKGVKFIPLPSEGFSGRIYRSEIQNLICRELDMTV